VIEVPPGICNTIVCNLMKKMNQIPGARVIFAGSSAIAW
jgi:hypothetical protein